MDPASHVVIVGAGFSGTLLAINLLRFDGPRATLIDRHAAQIGRGVAYSATQVSQLLNVRAAGMSAFPDDPAHFVRWLERQGEGTPQAFVPRATYGRYLQETLAAVRDANPERLEVREGDVCDIVRDDAGLRVILGDGAAVDADAVVLATGNLPPHTPPGLDPDALPNGVYRADPWRGDVAEGLGAEDTIILIGTGLTAIDVALKLDDAGFAGTILALSRRGLAPRRHLDGLPAAQGRSELPRGTLSDLVRDVRCCAQLEGWRAAVDALRPVTQRLWAASDRATRSRFLRHLRPFWDVHRHRLAPAVADRIDAMVAGGRLRFAAGKIMGVGADGGLVWRPRHGAAQVETRASRIVNCTGPQGDLTRSDDPLLRTLHARGTVRPDALCLGLDVDGQSRVVDREGRVAEDLCCIGPMTRGGLWEVVAVPDLRRQAWDLARRLANAQWIGGEGL